MTLSSKSAVQLSLKQYTSIISTLLLAKETSAMVNRIIRYIREAKLKSDLVFYTALIDYYAKRTLLDQTLKYTRRAMLSDNIKPKVITYAKLGHIERGRYSGACIASVFPNEFTYYTIMDAYCNKSQINEALNFLTRCKKRHKTRHCRYVVC